MPERDREDGFLGRWSRRKLEARDSGYQPTTDRTERPSSAEDAAQPGEQPLRPAEDARGDADHRMLTEEDFADVDFDALDASSDYERFMGANVPDAIRNRALAKLWTSDPQFAGLDPLHDYHGDFTDAAVASPGGVRTAYRLFRGFLSDDDVAAWDSLGKPPTEVGAQKSSGDGEMTAHDNPAPAAVAAAAAHATAEAMAASPLCCASSDEPHVG